MTTPKKKLLTAFVDDARRMEAKAVRTGEDILPSATRLPTTQVNVAIPGEMHSRLGAIAEAYGLKVPEVLRVAALFGLPRAITYYARRNDLIGKEEALEQKFIAEVRSTNEIIDFAIEHAADPQKIEDACSRLAGSATSAEEGASRRCSGGEAV